MSLDIVKKIVKALDDKKANDIQVMKTQELTIVADYFVIATANSNTHVRALADEVEYKLGLEGIDPTKVEGRGQGTWVLLDFDSVLVHVFNPQSREYYNLEKLWADGEEIPFEATED